VDDGWHSRGRRVDEAAGHVGYMLQKDLLLPWRSALDNLMLGLDIGNIPKPRAREIAVGLIRAHIGSEAAEPIVTGVIGHRFQLIYFEQPGSDALIAPFCTPSPLLNKGHFIS